MLEKLVFSLIANSVNKQYVILAKITFSFSLAELCTASTGCGQFRHGKMVKPIKIVTYMVIFKMSMVTVDTTINCSLILYLKKKRYYWSFNRNNQTKSLFSFIFFLITLFLFFQKLHLPILLYNSSFAG